MECEKELVKSGVKFATIRPVYILGPKNYCDRENFIYSHIKKGEILKIPGNGEVVAQFVFADEVARSVVLLAEKQLGGAYNCAGDEIVTMTGLVQGMGQIVGKTPKIKFDPAAIGKNYREDEFPFDSETVGSFIVDNSKLKAMGIKFASLFEGLARDYDSFYKATT